MCKKRRRYSGAEVVLETLLTADCCSSLPELVSDNAKHILIAPRAINNLPAHNPMHVTIPNKQVTLLPPRPETERHLPAVQDTNDIASFHHSRTEDVVSIPGPRKFTIARRAVGRARPLGCVSSARPFLKLIIITIRHRVGRGICAGCLGQK